MSAIFGILNLDSAPVEAQTLQDMAAALAYRGPHRQGLWQTDTAGLGHFLLATTPEAVAERQPLAHTQSGLVLAADARLDNRDELLAALGADIPTRGAGEVITDADLILAAYLRWGEACAARLVGDFAFAVLAPGERRVFLARDPAGMRQLVYFNDGRRVLFATSLEGLLAVLPPQPVNRAILLDFAAGVFDRIPSETPYAAIHRLPPAHSLTVTPQAARLQRYFTYGLDESARGLRADARAERLTELLAQAVRSCLRSVSGVAIAGAGGLDSGGIMTLAQRELSTGRAHAPLGVYAAVFPATPEAGEDEYLQAIEAVCPDVRFTRVDAEGDWYMKPVPEPSVHPMPDLDMLTPEWAMLYHLMQTARADGCGVFLNGSYGDAIFAEFVYDSLSCLMDVPLSVWRREWPFYRSKLRYPIANITAALANLIPAGPRRRLRNAIGWRGPSSGLPAPDQVVLDHPAYTAMPEPERLSFAGRRMHQRLFNGQASARQLASDQLGGRLGLEVRRPYLDRRLVDFVLQLTANDLAQGGVTRRLYRQAMVGILPEKVRQRATKVHFNHLVQRGLDGEEKVRIQAMLGDLQAARCGLVDAGALQAAFAAYWSGEFLNYRRILWPLALETWLLRNPAAIEQMQHGAWKARVGAD